MAALSLLLTVALAALLTGLLRRYALRTQLLDIPNARSSHAVPTPRGGGLAIVVCFTGAVLLLGGQGMIAGGLLAALLGALAIATVGFIDDRSAVPVRVRLLVHLLAAVWALAWLGGMPALPLFGLELQLGGVGLVLGVLFAVWLLNLYNFMDGIDGIAGVQAVTAGAGAALLLLVQGEAAALLPALLAAAAAGFLIWNWPPAKIFMGDVGSAYLGFVFAVLALSGLLNIWAWLILLGVFIVDATYTLLRRLVAGERIFQAHRSHAYQRAARRFQSHAKVTVAVGVLSVVWLWPLAWLAARYPESGLMLLLLAWAPLLLLVAALGAGRRDEAMLRPG